MKDKLDDKYFKSIRLIDCNEKVNNYNGQPIRLGVDYNEKFNFIKNHGTRYRNCITSSKEINDGLLRHIIGIDLVISTKVPIKSRNDYKDYFSPLQISIDKFIDECKQLNENKLLIEFHTMFADNNYELNYIFINKFINSNKLKDEINKIEDDLNLINDCTNAFNKSFNHLKSFKLNNDGKVKFSDEIIMM